MLTFGATEPAHVVLRLPLPPSANRIWRVGKGGGVHKADAYKAWLQQAGWACLMQRAGDHIPYRYHLLLTLPEQPKDADNILKPLGDLLQKQRVVTNDRYLRRLGLQVDPTREPGTMLVQLWATDEPAPKPRKRKAAA